MSSYKNRPGMTFDDTAATPDQSFQMYEDRTGSTEYATRSDSLHCPNHKTIELFHFVLIE